MPKLRSIAKIIEEAGPITRDAVERLSSDLEGLKDSVGGFYRNGAISINVTQIQGATPSVRNVYGKRGVKNDGGASLASDVTIVWDPAYGFVHAPGTANTVPLTINPHASQAVDLLNVNGSLGSGLHILNSGFVGIFDGAPEAYLSVKALPAAVGEADILALNPIGWWAADDPNNDSGATLPSNGEELLSGVSNGGEGADEPTWIWKDKSGNNRDQTADTAYGSRPLWYNATDAEPAPSELPNGKPVVSFLGSRNVGQKTFTYIGPLGDYTVYAVVYIPAVGGPLLGEHWPTAGDNSRAGYLRVQDDEGNAGDTSKFYAQKTEGGPVAQVDWETGNDFSATPWRRVLFRRDSTTHLHKIDDTTIAIDSSEGTLSQNLYFEQLMKKEDSATGSTYWSTWLAEVLVFDSALSESEQATVESYLDAKYETAEGAGDTDTATARNLQEWKSSLNADLGWMTSQGTLVAQTLSGLDVDSNTGTFTGNVEGISGVNDNHFITLGQFNDTGDEQWLRLDTSNDPLTATLSISGTGANEPLHLWGSDERRGMAIGFSANGNRLYFAPWEDGSWQYSNEFAYSYFSNRWEVETDLYVGGDVYENGVALDGQYLKLDISNDPLQVDASNGLELSGLNAGITLRRTVSEGFIRWVRPDGTSVAQLRNDATYSGLVFNRGDGVSNGDIINAYDHAQLEFNTRFFGSLRASAKNLGSGDIWAEGQLFEESPAVPLIEKYALSGNFYPYDRIGDGVNVSGFWTQAPVLAINFGDDDDRDTPATSGWSIDFPGNTAYTTAIGCGWTPTGSDDRDRGIAGYSYEENTFHSSTATRYFNLNVPGNQEYFLYFVMGDANGSPGKQFLAVSGTGDIIYSGVTDITPGVFVTGSGYFRGTGGNLVLQHGNDQTAGNRINYGYIVPGGMKRTFDFLNDIRYEQSGTVTPAMKEDVNAFNGAVRESIQFLIGSDGSTVSGVLSNSSDGNLTYQFSGLNYTFTPSGIDLTAGTDTAPTQNFVWVELDGSTPVLNISTVGFPSISTQQHSPVATVVLQSAASVQSDEPYKVHYWTDHIRTDSYQGHISDINARIRQEHAVYENGVSLTYKDDTGASLAEDTNASEIYLVTSAGTVWQMHRHTFSATDGYTSRTDPILYQINKPNPNEYTITSGLHSIDEDAQGTSTSNKSFNVVLWGIASQTGSQSKLMLNLPNGVYNAVGQAEEDADETAIYDIPVAYRGTAFLIARITVQNVGANYQVVNTVDLRGQIPSIFAGGGAAGGGNTIYEDNAFQLIDGAAATATGQFVLDNVTAGQNRLVTWPDQDVDLEPGVSYMASGTSFSGLAYVQDDAWTSGQIARYDGTNWVPYEQIPSFGDTAPTAGEGYRKQFGVVTSGGVDFLVVCLSGIGEYTWETIIQGVQ